MHPQATNVESLTDRNRTFRKSASAGQRYELLNFFFFLFAISVFAGDKYATDTGDK